MNGPIIEMFVGSGLFKHSTSTTLKSCSFAWSGKNLGCPNSTNVYRSLSAMHFTLVQ
jgi:hypothetical protein